jgi:hypothetical protein
VVDRVATISEIIPEHVDRNGEGGRDAKKKE